MVTVGSAQISVTTDRPALSQMPDIAIFWIVDQSQRWDARPRPRCNTGQPLWLHRGGNLPIGEQSGPDAAGAKRKAALRRIGLRRPSAWLPRLRRMPSKKHPALT